MPKPKKNEAKQDFLKRCTAELIDQEDKNADQAFAQCNALWDNSRGKKAGLTLMAPLLLEKSEEEQKVKGFRMAAYTGQLIERWWGGRYIIDVAGMKAKAKIPVLREHLRDRVVGYSTKSWKDERNFYMAGEFSQVTKDGQEVLALAEEGFPWQASVAVWPRQVLMVKEKEQVEINGQKFTGPLEVWSKCLVGEVSFVALGADDQTAAIVLAQETEIKVPVDIRPSKEEQLMEITLTLLEQEAPDLLQKIREMARSEGVEEGQRGERARVMEILGADGDPATSRKAIEDGIAAAETFKLLFAAERARRQQDLKDLEAGAPLSLGQTPPPDPPATDNRPPDVILAEKARELAARENIDLAEAQKQVFADPENAGLVTKWQPGGVH